MRVPALPLAAILCWTACAGAQVPGNRNGVRLHSTPQIAFLRSFAGYFAGGTQSGDAIYQIYPRRALENAAGSLELTAVVLPIFVQNYAAPGLVELPDIALRATAPAAGSPGACLEADFAAAPLGQVLTPALQLPGGGAYEIEFALVENASQNGLTLASADVALSIEATPGESIVTSNSVRLLVSHEGTSPDPNSCGFGAVGVYNPTQPAIEHLAISVELLSEMAFREPLLAALTSRDGGATIDEGFGALDPPVGGLARIGWRLEAFQGIGQVFLPFSSFSGASLPFALGGHSILLDPDPFFDMLLVFQQAAVIAGDGAPAPATDGIWQSFLFPLPADPLLDGLQMSVAGFLFDFGGTNEVVGASNTVTMTLHL